MPGPAAAVGRAFEPIRCEHFSSRRRPNRGSERLIERMSMDRRGRARRTAQMGSASECKWHARGLSCEPAASRLGAGVGETASMAGTSC